MSNVVDWAIDKQRNGILLQGQRPQKIPTLPNLSIKASFRTRKTPMAGFTYSDRAANLLRFFLRAPTPTSDAWQVAQEEESSSKSDSCLWAFGSFQLPILQRSQWLHPVTSSASQFATLS